MTPEQREITLKGAVDRAHSFHSAGHWDAATPDLISGWQAADKKVTEALTANAVFLAAIGREQCAMVLKARQVRGPWDA